MSNDYKLAHGGHPDAAPRFSCHLERDFGKAPCDRDCGKLRCMYPTNPSALTDTEVTQIISRAHREVYGDATPIGMPDIAFGLKVVEGIGTAAQAEPEPDDTPLETGEGDAR